MLEIFPNTFAPACDAKTLTTREIIGLIKYSGLQTSDLPPIVAKCVRAELNRRRAKLVHN